MDELSNLVLNSSIYIFHFNMNIKIIRIIACISFSLLGSVMIHAQYFSRTYKIFEQERSEGGHSIIEYNNRWFVSGSNRCNNYMNDCSYMTEFDHDGEILMNRLFDWKDTGIRDEFFIKNDTIVFSGHTNGHVDPIKYASTLTRLTLDGDSIDSYTYPVLRDSIYAIINFGVIEYEDHYYLHGDVGQIDGPPLGIIQKVKKTGEFVAEYFYENPDGDGDNFGASHVFALQLHPELGMVFINYLAYPAGAGWPREKRQIVQFDPKTEQFYLIYESELMLGQRLVHTLTVMEDGSIAYFRTWENSSSLLSVVWINPQGEIIQKYEIQFSDILEFNSNPGFYYVSNMRKTADNGFLISGGVDYYETDEIHTRGYIIKISPDAELEWQRMIAYTPEYNVFRDGYISDAKELSDGSILATGFVTLPYGDNQIDRDYWLLHLDEKGCLYEGEDCDEEQLTTSTLDIGQENIISQKPFTIYPNPTTDRIFIERHMDATYVFEIYNMQGHKIRSGSETNQDIDVSQWPTGLYQIIFKKGDGSVWSEKLMVE